MAIRTFQPAASVWLFKTILRNAGGMSRRASGRKAISIERTKSTASPYLAEQGRGAYG